MQLNGQQVRSKWLLAKEGNSESIINFKLISEDQSPSLTLSISLWPWNASEMNHQEARGRYTSSEINVFYR